MPTLCTYKGKILSMTDADIKKALIDAENSLRTGNFQYAKLPMQPRVNDLKKNWSKEAQLYVRTAANTIANGSNITEDVVAKAIIETCKTHVAPIRAKINKTTAENEFLYMAPEIALATLFNIAPDSGESSVPKSYGSTPSGVPTPIRVKGSSVPKRLVVDVERVDEAGIYIQALLVKSLNMSYLIGWATKADILACKKGDKSTDEECNWSKMAYYMPLENLRPMSEFLRTYGLKEIPSEVVFEKVPKLADLPVPTSPESQLMLISRPAKEEQLDDFMSFCGISNSPTTGVQL